MKGIIHKEKGNETQKQKKHRWKETIAVRNALRTPKHVKYVKSNQRQRTSPNHPNIFFLGGQLELEHINKVSCSKKIETHLCARLNIPKTHRIRKKINLKKK